MYVCMYAHIFLINVCTYVCMYGINLLCMRHLSRLYYQHSEEEVAEMNALSGLERVRRSLCLRENLLPDEDTRVFATVR